METMTKRTREGTRKKAKRLRDGNLAGGAMQIKSQLAMFMVRFFLV